MKALLLIAACYANYMVVGYRASSENQADGHNASSDHHNVKKRAIPQAIIKFGASILMGLGQKWLEDQVFESNTDEKLAEILDGLKKVEADISTIKATTKDIKAGQTYVRAFDIESDILEFIDRYKHITEAIRSTVQKKQNGTDTKKEELNIKNELQNLRDDIKKEMPKLLFKIHRYIVGNGASDNGRIKGLFCDWIEHLLNDIRTSNIERIKYSITEFVKQAENFRDKLLLLQDLAWQIYNSTCSPDEILCQGKLKTIAQNQKRQREKFKSCMPEAARILSESAVNPSFYLTRPGSREVVFTRQKKSIVNDRGTFDWDDINSPEASGLQCANETDVKEAKWKFVQESKLGSYSLKGEDGCFLSFDRSFINYEKSVPILWASGDRIDRRELLICLPEKTNDVATFFIKPTEAKQTTRYLIINAETGKYFKIHTEKTSVHDKIDHRLVLTLFLHQDNADDGSKWLIGFKGIPLCKGPSEEKYIDGSDSSYIGIIIGSSVGVLVLVVVVVVVVGCVYCRQKKQG